MKYVMGWLQSFTKVQWYSNGRRRPSLPTLSQMSMSFSMLVTVCFLFITEFTFFSNASHLCLAAFAENSPRRRRRTGDDVIEGPGK